MPRTLEQRTAVSKTFPLPVKRCSELSHVDNILHCIEQISISSDKGVTPVVGYFIERTALGTRHTLYRILPIQQAEELRKNNPRFSYATLPEFIKRNEEIERGEYKMQNGQIVGFKPA